MLKVNKCIQLERIEDTTDSGNTLGSNDNSNLKSCEMCKRLLKDCMIENILAFSCKEMLQLIKNLVAMIYKLC